MEVREATSRSLLSGASTQELRSHYLVRSLFQPGQLRLVYCHEDRLVLGGAVPAGRKLTLEPEGPVNGPHFLSNREAGILHLGGGGGLVTVDGKEYQLAPRDILYVGRGAEQVAFEGVAADNPPRLYIVSAVAHAAFLTVLVREEDVAPIALGTAANASRRDLRVYIPPDRHGTAALMMGITTVHPGSVWNTVPAHTHDRRSEVYLYFDLASAERVIHLMGPPAETRSLVVSNEEAVISPPWSIHMGAGTAPYRFCWVMAGENAEYADMDPAPPSVLA